MVAFLTCYKGWRTIAINAALAALIAIVEIAGYLAGFGGWGVIFSAETAAWIMLGTNILNIILRCLTTTRVGKGG